MPNSVEEIWNLATQPGFLTYATTTLLLVAALVIFFEPQYGQTNIPIYLGISSSMGSLTVISIKAIGVAIKLTLDGMNQYAYPHTWLSGQYGRRSSFLLIRRLSMSFKQRALNKLVERAYRKLQGIRVGSRHKAGVSKSANKAENNLAFVLAFAGHTLARCQKFEGTKKSCFSEPSLWSVLSAPWPSSDAKCTEGVEKWEASKARQNPLDQGVSRWKRSNRERDHNRDASAKDPGLKLGCHSLGGFPTKDKVGSWYRNPGTGVAGSTSDGGGVGKYLKARIAGSTDMTGNAAVADDSSKKRKANAPSVL